MKVNTAVNLERKTERLMVSLLPDSCLVAIEGMGSAELLLKRSACSERGVLAPRWRNLVVMEKEEWRHRWIESWGKGVAMHQKLWCGFDCRIGWYSLEKTGMYRCLLRMLVALKEHLLSGHLLGGRSTEIEEEVWKEHRWQKACGIREPLVVEKKQR